MPRTSEMDPLLMDWRLVVARFDACWLTRVYLTMPEFFGKIVESRKIRSRNNLLHAGDFLLFDPKGSNEHWRLLDTQDGETNLTNKVLAATGFNALKESEYGLSFVHVFDEPDACREPFFKVKRRSGFPVLEVNLAHQLSLLESDDLVDYALVRDKFLSASLIAGFVDLGKSVRSTKGI